MNVVILAAGVGKRMQSRLPKVLHPIAGRAMLARVIDTAKQLPDARIVVVVGHEGDQVRNAFANEDLQWAVQSPQLGTGHAVLQAVPALDDSETTLVLYGDVPLTRVETLRHLSRVALAGATPSLAILTVVLDHPTGYGRIVRSADGCMIESIVEEKDATDAVRAITEVNTGILVAPTSALKAWLGRLSNDNAQREYYLTDVVSLARGDGIAVVAAHPSAEWETVGVNDKHQLAALERRYQRNQANALLTAGVTLADPDRIDVRGTLVCGQDVTIDVGCVFEGVVRLGDGVSVGPYAVVDNAVVGAFARINAFSVVAGHDANRPVEIAEGSVIGPGGRS